MDEAFDGAVADRSAVNVSGDAAAGALGKVDDGIDMNPADCGRLAVAHNDSLVAGGSVICITVDVKVADSGPVGVSEESGGSARSRGGTKVAQSKASAVVCALERCGGLLSYTFKGSILQVDIADLAIIS